MTLQQLRYIITISEAGSLSKAAQILYISQPSLTSSVRELENELGITIFHRSGKGMSLTNDGVVFLSSARYLYTQYESLMEQYDKNGPHKKRFAISAQHYSFAVKSFVELVKRYNTAEYEFAVRETKTREVIEDVSTMRSEIGVIYLSDFNRKAMMKVLSSNGLEFHKLIDCKAYAYMSKSHPLAESESVSFKELEDYPCLSFEQGGESSFYYAEEIFSTNHYPRMIKVSDRATILNLMVGLNGYTVCSGIICGELNGDGYIAIPIEDAGGEEIMEIGYIVKKELIMSKLAVEYIDELKRYLNKQ